MSHQSTVSVAVLDADGKLVIESVIGGWSTLWIPDYPYTVAYRGCPTLVAVFLAKG